VFSRILRCRMILNIWSMSIISATISSYSSRCRKSKFLTLAKKCEPLRFVEDEGRTPPHMRAKKNAILRGIELICAALLFVFPHSGLSANDNLASAKFVAAAPMPPPDYLQPTRDPVFGTSFMRITDPGKPLLAGTSCGVAYCTHRYSSAQAWNADQGMLAIFNGCSGICFLDGQNYRPLFHRSLSGECEWHPTKPALMICLSEDAIYIWAPRSDVKTVVFASSNYHHLQFGPYKGNPSNDGKRLVVRATTKLGALVAFAYDITTKKKYPDIRLTYLPGSNGYCTISPSSRYIFCTQTIADGTEEGYVFTISGVQVQHWTEHHRPGHGDLTIDADGRDVYVGISKSDPDKYHIIKRRLADGVVTDLTPYGEGQHASIRNITRPGWVFLTYTGTADEVTTHPDWAPFYQEVVALRIDGSGELRRIVQTHNEPSDYWSETHASPSPDGSQIIWSSNWGTPGGPVADYVARLCWSEIDRRAFSPR
jgi:hypothetical protein